MKLVANNGEVLAEWTPDGTKRNLYCSGGFGLMLTKRALARVMAAEDDQTPDLFDDQTPEKEKTSREMLIDIVNNPKVEPEEKIKDYGVSIFGMRF